MTFRTIRAFPFRLASGQSVWHFPFYDDDGQIHWRFPFIQQLDEDDGMASSGIEEAPLDGKPYVRMDGVWVEQPLSMSEIYEFMFNETLAEPPSSGQVRMDNADQTQTTKIWLSNTTATSVDVGVTLDLIEPGWIIAIQDKDQSIKRQSYYVRDPIARKAGYIELTVQRRAGQDPLVAQRVMILILGNITQTQYLKV